jgi:hypothetical protein
VSCAGLTRASSVLRDDRLPVEPGNDDDPI